MAINLTQGAIEAICNGDEEIQPLLQVTDLRLVSTVKSIASERFRLLLSDGLYLQQGMLATQHNEFVKSGALKKGSILRLLRYTCSEVQNRKIILVAALEVIQETCPTIGEPQYIMNGGARPTAEAPSSVGQPGMIPGNAQHSNLHSTATGSSPRPSAAAGALQQPKLEHPVQMQSYGSSLSNSVSGQFTTNNESPLRRKPEVVPGNSMNTAAAGPHRAFLNAQPDVSRAPPNIYARQQQPSYQQSSYQQSPSYQRQNSMYMNRGPVAKNDASPNIHQIGTLDPFKNRWTIKARVTAKGDLRHYNNARGDGKVFSFDLLDAHGGEIRVTCFNSVADQFYSLIEVGKVYLISKGTLKPAQKTFNHLDHDYEIMLDNTSLVQPCLEDDSDIPRQQFHFRPIIDIEGIENNGVVDVIGVVSSITPSSSLMRKNGTETQKRSLQLKDMSGRSVELTLWGNFCNVEGQALQTIRDSGNFPVLAVKSVRVYEFNGKGVGTISTSQLFIEPDFPEAQRLKEWFYKEGKNMPSVSISRETASLVRNDARKTISQIKDEKLGTFEKPDWITVCATLSFIKSDSFCYPACPNAVGDRKCSKKVINNGDGKWSCDKCDLTFDECEYKYVLQLQMLDHTSLTWVTAFQEVGEEILGISANDLYYLKNEAQDEDKFLEITRGVAFNKYIFKLRVKEETFNDEQRVKSTIVKAERLDFTSESRSLLAAMDKFKVGESGVPSVDNFTPISGANKLGIHQGVSQPVVSGVNYGTTSGLSGRETGMHSNITNQFGNQYSGGYAGGAAASGINMTCSSCGGTGHNSINCPSIINSQGAFGNQTIPAGNNPGQCYKCQKIGHFSKDCPGLSSVPPAYGGNNLGPGRYGGVQRQHVGGF